MSDNKELTCICCPIGCSLFVRATSEGYEISGNKCPRGKKYALAEMTAPKRIVTSTVKVVAGNHPVVSVKTVDGIPKEKIFEVMDILTKAEIKAPVKVGDVVVSNILDTGVDVVATANREARN